MANSLTGPRSRSPRCSAASACRVADSPSATARSAASACRARTCQARKSRRRRIRPAAPFLSRASPTCCSRPMALTSSTAVARSIPTSVWSIGPAAIPSITTRISTACARPGRSRTPSSSTTAGGRRPRVMPISCCRRRPRWSATTSAAPHATLTCSRCTAPSRRSASAKRFRDFPRPRWPPRLRGCLHRGPRRDGLVPLDL